MLHASWNLISKKHKPSAAFFLAANTVGCLILLTVCAARLSLYSAFPPFAWKLLVITGMFQAGYYTALAGAYRTGEMSLAYPLARSSPVLIVTVAAFVLGQADSIGAACFVGIFLVVAGCFLLPMKTFSDFSVKNYLSRTCGLAMLAAVGTAGYTIADAEALASVRKHLAGSGSLLTLTALYAFAEAISSSVWLAVYVATRRSERAELKLVLRSGLRPVLLSGVGIYITYLLVLTSMSYVQNVSYVAGFRQLSIPLGVAMGAVFLKEPIPKPKAIGVAVLCLGLVLIAAG